MAEATSGRVPWRFGRFELDAEGKQLLENGKPVRLPEQSQAALVLLLRHAGEVVSREQFQGHLWPGGTEVDVEQALSTIIRRVRRTLGDDLIRPRYVATVIGQGYRFIGTLEAEGEAPVPHPQRRWYRWRWTAGGIAGLVLALSVVGWVGLDVEPQPRVTSIRALTTDGGMDLPGRPATDGRLLYYLDRAGGHWNLMRSAGDPALAARVATPFTDTNSRLFDISRDHSEWLLGSFTERGTLEALWRKPVPGGTPVRMGTLAAYDAVWVPDGKHVVYSAQNALWSAGIEGNAIHRLATLPDSNADWLAWSPDGSRLSFTLGGGSGQSLWEWSAAGGARRLPAPEPRCCGNWTAGGRYFVYSAETNGRWNLWAQRQRRSWEHWLWPWRQDAPVQLTFEARPSWGAFTGFGPRQVVFYEGDWREEAQRYDAASKVVSPLLPDRFAIEVTYAPDGRRIAYIDTRDATLWTADISAGGAASNFRKLTQPGMMAASPRWSPDGASIAYGEQSAAQPWQVHRISAGGGPAQRLSPVAAANDDIQIPDWSPDGKRLAVAVVEHRDGQSNRAWIGVLAQGQLTRLPGSDDLCSPRWSPDGRWLAAYRCDQQKMEIYSFARQRWQVIATGNAFTYAVWSRDGKYLYIQDILVPGEPLYRARSGSWKLERVADFSALLRGDIHRCLFVGLAPDGEFVLSLNRGNADLYAAKLALP